MSVPAVGLRRNGNRWQIVLSDWRGPLRDTIKQVPFATYEPETRSWSAPVTTQSLDILRRLRWQGSVDVDPDTLIAAGEQIVEAKLAELRPGSSARPFIVHMAASNDQLYRTLTAIPGSRWSKESQAVTYPPQAALRLAKLVDDGVVDDPQRVVNGDGVTVFFDTYTGQFVVRGDNRAAAWFTDKFPQRDVMSIWEERDLNVRFADDLTREIYLGELARVGDGLNVAGLNVELFDFQRRDVAVLVARTGTGLFSAMGVGKTAVAIAGGHELLTNRSTVTRNVIVVPPALRTQWQEEIIRFTGDSVDDIVVIDGPKKKRAAQYEAAYNAKWVVIHYQAVLLGDAKEHLPKLTAGAYLVADEVHRLKDHTTATTKQMQGLAKRAAVRVGLSGTPVENRPGEWYTVLSGFVYPGIFGPVTEFLNTYSYPGSFGGYEGARNLPALSARSKLLYVRHKLDDVAEHLPPMRVQTVVLEPKPDYAVALKQLHREARNEIAADRVERATAAKVARNADSVLDGYDRDELEQGAEMTAVSMLKLACCSPRLLHMSDAPAAVALVAAGIVPDEDGPKIDRLRTIAAEKQSNGDRIVVFATSKRLVKLVSERLTSDGIRHVTYTGDTKRGDRDAAVTAFITPGDDDNPGPTVFLSTDAGAEGLNLGRCCSMVVNLDIPWTPGRLGQRNARVRRLDSTAKGFLVVNLVVAGTIEAAFVKLVDNKADLADAILGEDGGRKVTTGRHGRNVFAELLDTVTE